VSEEREWDRCYIKVGNQTYVDEEYLTLLS
jgi:hypothetical protein